MNLNEARAVKNGLLRTRSASAFVVAAEPATESMTESMTEGATADAAGESAAGLAAITAPPGVALGLRAVDERYELAVRIVRESTEADAFVRAAEAVTGGELDVRVTGTIHAYVNGNRARPLTPGASVGHVDTTAGTLGAFVRCAQCGQVGVLSNNHVLAMENAAAQGDAIVQPGPYDGGLMPADRIGQLERFVKLRKHYANRVDAAFAVLDEGVEYDVRAPLHLDRIADLPSGQNFPVQKLGRTTGHTTGVVTAFEVDDVPVRYPGLGEISFDGVTEIRGDGGAFSAGGDSGSVIFGRDDGVAYGLLFAGTEGDDGLTFGNPLAEVMRELDVDSVGAGGDP